MGKLPVLDAIIISMEHQESRLTTLSRRKLGDELLGEVIVKIGKIHLFFQKKP